MLRAAKAQWPGVTIILGNVSSKDNRRQAVRREYQLIEEIVGRGMLLGSDHGRIAVGCTGPTRERHSRRMLERWNETRDGLWRTY